MKDNQLRPVFEGITRFAEQQAKVIESLSKEYYQSALNEVRARVADAYGKYGESGSLNYAEMQQYNKIGKMMKTVDEATQTGLRGVGPKLNKILQETAASSYGKAANTAPRDLPKLTSQQVSDLLAKVRTNTATIEERLSLMQRDTSLRVQTQIKQNLLRNSPLEDTYDDVGKVFDRAYARDMQALGDLNHHVSQKAVDRAVKNARESGMFPVKTWVTCGDDKVRPAHASLDGQTVDANELFTVGQDSAESTEWDGWQAEGPGMFGEPALDYNCRCWIVVDWREGEEETSTFAPDENPELSEELIEEMMDAGMSEEDIAEYEETAIDYYEEFINLEGDSSEQAYSGWQIFIDMEDAMGVG